MAAKGRNTLVYLFDNDGSFLFSLDYEGNLMTTTMTAGGQIGICATSPDRMNYDLLTVDMKSLDWSKDKIYLGATAGLYGGVNKDFYRFDSSFYMVMQRARRRAARSLTGRIWDLAHQRFILENARTGVLWSWQPHLIRLRYYRMKWRF